VAHKITTAIHCSPVIVTLFAFVAPLQADSFSSAYYDSKTNEVLVTMPSYGARRFPLRYPTQRHAPRPYLGARSGT
jgi:hypothetical protein